MPVFGGTTLKLSKAFWPQRRKAYRSRFLPYSFSVFIASAEELPKASTCTE
jgi:hypothetical protein